MAETRNPRKPIKRSHKGQKQTHQKTEKPPPWGTLRSFFSCKYHQTAVQGEKKLRRIGWSGSLCNLRDSSKVMQRPESTSPKAYKSGCNSLKAPLTGINGAVTTSSSSSSFSHSSASITPSSSSSSSSSSSLGGFSRGMHLRRLSGCYECHMAVDPITGVSRVPSLRATIYSCSDCDEIFTKSESLELHQAVKHAVSELGPEDTSRNIVEIIFQSSWLKKQAPFFKIDRILKIHNTQRTITRFETYRNSIKSRANKLAKKYPRCIADGNELLRFYCTNFNCSLGLNGSTNLCLLDPKLQYLQHYKRWVQARRAREDPNDGY